MKTYIGIKAVQAAPAFRPQPTASDPLAQDEGYRVRYPDGYESWSPKAAFEEAYREAPADEADGILGSLHLQLYNMLHEEDPGPPLADEAYEIREIALGAALKAHIGSPLGADPKKVVETAALFAGFLLDGGVKVTVEPALDRLTASAVVDRRHGEPEHRSLLAPNEMLEETRGGAWADEFIEQTQYVFPDRDDLVLWFSDAIETGRGAGYAAALIDHANAQLAPAPDGPDRIMSPPERVEDEKPQPARVADFDKYPATGYAESEPSGLGIA